MKFSRMIRIWGGVNIILGAMELFLGVYELNLFFLVMGLALIWFGWFPCPQMAKKLEEIKQ